MNSCKRVMRLIDESHRPEMLPIEAVAHVETCSNCRQFAGERETLRNLLTLGSRVTVPANFDAVLTRKLADVKGRRSLAWLNPAVYARVAFAAAALVVAAVMVPQYLDRPEPNPATPNDVVATTPEEPKKSNGAVVLTPGVRPTTPEAYIKPIARPRYASRGSSPRNAAGYIGEGGAGVMLIRAESGEIEMPIRPVSVGAEPFVYPGDLGQTRRSARSF